MAARDLIRFDWAIKRLLRNKANFDVLEGFLGVLLNDEIHILKIGESEGNSSSFDDKFNKVDILVENDREEIFLIELQNANQDDYYLRMLYGVSKAITDHMSRGMSYANVRKVYSINILYFDLGKGDDYVFRGTTDFKGIHSSGILQLTDKQKQLFGKDEINCLFPEYYIILVKYFDDVAKDSLDEWIYYLKHNEIPDNFSARGLSQARNKLRIDKLPNEERESYYRHLENVAVGESVMATSRRDGMREGIEIGRKEGIETGRKEGVETGIQEGINSKNRRVIVSGHISGLAPEVLGKLTDLSEGEVLKILKEEGFEI